MTLSSRRAAIGLIGAGLAAPALVSPARAEPIFLDSLGIAIKGYDPVAYFEIQEAKRGSLDFELETREGNWWFTRQEYMDMFKRAPEKYMPQFGGYDAEGIARGFKRRSDPTLWVLIDGKIYLHYSIPDQNRWAEDIRGNIRQAEENWPGLKKL